MFAHEFGDTIRPGFLHKMLGGRRGCGGTIQVIHRNRWQSDLRDSCLGCFPLENWHLVMILKWVDIFVLSQKTETNGSMIPMITNLTFTLHPEIWQNISRNKNCQPGTHPWSRKRFILRHCRFWANSFSEIQHLQIYKPQYNPGKTWKWIPTRWAPTSCKWSYNPYKWLDKWVSGVITHTNRVVGAARRAMMMMMLLILTVGSP